MKFVSHSLGTSMDYSPLQYNAMITTSIKYFDGNLYLETNMSSQDSKLQHSDTLSGKDCVYRTHQTNCKLSTLLIKNGIVA